MNQKSSNFLIKRRVEAVLFLLIFFGTFTFIGSKMGLPNMLNTIMQTSYSLLIETVFYIMAITVLSGALGSLLTEFGVVRLLEVALQPLMKPIFNLPGVAALGGLMTFLSDNPAVISLAKEKHFNRYFKKYEIISLTNFGTAFGMGLVVIIFMAGRGFGYAAIIGLAGSIIGSVVSTRMMQRITLKSYPELDAEIAEKDGNQDKISFKSEGSFFLRALNSILDGGKTGVELGLGIIPGVLVISTIVMILTFGPSSEGYTGGAYEGIALLPYLAEKIDFVFRWMFGFEHPELIAFPITSLGAVGGALSLIPKLQAEGFIDGNAIAVFTAMGMCWSGYLSTHTAMLDALGYRKLTSKAIISHTVGGLAAGVSAHWIYYFISMVLG